MKMAGVYIKSLAPIGASLTFLALVSGAIWGQPTWGTWWVWDARLTSTLVLFLFYLAIIGMQSTFSSRKSADTAISIITLVGLINLPIVKKSVDWWNTLHQPASISITGESSISSEMLTPLLLSMLTLMFLEYDLSAFIFLGLIGITNGLANVLGSSTWAEIYGVKFIGSIKALTTALMVFSTAFGTALFGVLIDQGFSIEEIALIGATYIVVSLILLLIFRKKLEPVNL